MDDFASDESHSEHDYFHSTAEEKNYLLKLQSECENYEHVVEELEKEKADRYENLKDIQNEIEKLQMEIMYNDLKIEKAQNVFDELDDIKNEKSNVDAQERFAEEEKLNQEVTKNLKKYINRMIYSRKVEYEEKSEKKKAQYSGVCVKYFKDDPTNEEYGQFNAQNFNYQVFGISDNLTFSGLFNIAREHWKVSNYDDYVLTDQDHHDLSLLFNVPITNFLAHETHGYALFILRPRNTRMKELIASQKDAILLVHEYEKQGKIKDEYQRVFDAVKKAKPGIDTYQLPEEAGKKSYDIIDGSLINFLFLLTVLILMLVSLSISPVQPSDVQIMINQNYSTNVPAYYDSNGQFIINFPKLLEDITEPATPPNEPITRHLIPIGVKRIIMNKMKPQACTNVLRTTVCPYPNSFTDSATVKSDLTNVADGSWKHYTEVPDDQKIHIYTQYNNFDGSGYIYDFPIGKTETEVITILRNDLNLGNGGDFFDEDSRAYIFQSLFYETNRLIIVERVVVFEFTASGVVEITEKKGYYRPHIKDSEEKAHLRLDIGLLVMTILAYLINIGAHVIREKSKKEIIKPGHLLKYVIVILVVVYFIIFHHGTDKAMEEIVTSTGFQTFIKYESQREAANFILCLALCLHCLNMIRSLVFSKAVYMFLDIFAESLKDFWVYFLMYFSTLMAFAFVWYVSFSAYESNLGSIFSTAFEIILLYATGDTFTLQSIYETSGAWASILVILTLIIVFVELDALMMSIIQENVRYLYLKEKQQEEQKLPFKEMLEKMYQRIEALRGRIQNVGKKSQRSAR